MIFSAYQWLWTDLDIMYLTKRPLCNCTLLLEEGGEGGMLFDCLANEKMAPPPSPTLNKTLSYYLELL